MNPDQTAPLERRNTRGSHITYYSHMLFIAYTFKGQVHVFAGQVKIVCHSSCRTSAILKYFCLLILFHFNICRKMETSGSEETKQQQKVPQKVHYDSALLSLLVILPSLHINKTPKNKIIPYIYNSNF